MTGGASEDHEPVCNKDTGAKQKSLQKWSRGLLHFVHGGGHIESWSPLFVSGISVEDIYSVSLSGVRNNVTMLYGSLD